MTEQELLDRVIYRDGMILVLNKPAGIAVHPGPGKGPNLESMFHWLQYGLPRPPALVHRLDRDTSGCLVLGRHRKALARAGKLFAGNNPDRRAGKTYWALCVGAPAAPEGVIDAKLVKKNDRLAGWEMKIAADGDKEAVTAVTGYKVIASHDGYSLIEFSPKTGRTHQIRVHAAHIGCPLQGDPKYGEMSEINRAAPFCLHALRIVLPLYPNREPLEVEAPLPEAFRQELINKGLKN